MQQDGQKDHRGRTGSKGRWLATHVVIPFVIMAIGTTASIIYARNSADADKQKKIDTTYTKMINEACDLLIKIALQDFDCNPPEDNSIEIDIKGGHIVMNPERLSNYLLDGSRDKFIYGEVEINFSDSIDDSAIDSLDVDSLLKALQDNRAITSIALNNHPLCETITGSAQKRSDSGQNLKLSCSPEVASEDAKNKQSEPIDSFHILGGIRQSVSAASFVDPIRGHRLNRWTVTADPGTQVAVRVQSSEVDAVLYVLRDGEVQYSDDRAFLDSDSQIEFVMPESGDVPVLAGSYSADVEGDYSLVVEATESGYSRLLQEAPEPQGTLTPITENRQ